MYGVTVPLVGSMVTNFGFPVFTGCHPEQMGRGIGAHPIAMSRHCVRFKHFPIHVILDNSAGEFVGAVHRCRILIVDIDVAVIYDK